MVAAAVDSDAMDKLKGNSKDETVDEDLKVAAEFYGLAVTRSGGSGSKIDFGRVGQRLLYIGARLSKLSDDLSLMSIDPAVPIAAKGVIENAKKALRLAAPAGEIDVERQRAIAFTSAATGDWLEAVGALREITNKHLLFNPMGRLNKDALAAVPRLPDVYQDLAVAYLRASKGEKALCDSAKDILARLINNSEQTSKRYWEARYLHLLALKEAKEYAELDSMLDGLARMAPEADKGQYGIKAKIDEIRAFRDKKIVNK